MAKKKQKFYAVRIGRVPGIYNSWIDCSEQVAGFTGAKYKSFPTLEEANAYLRGEDTPAKSVAVQTKIPGIVAFVDGSYFNGEYGWGFAVFDNGKLIFKANGKGCSEESAKLHNVAGEIEAAKEAVLWAESNGVEKLIICHDYNGISEWGMGRWKTNLPQTQEYAEFMKSRRSWVVFHKVAGHTGVAGNELADQLAKAAIGLK